MLPGFIPAKRGNRLGNWLPGGQNWSGFGDYMRMKPLSYLRNSSRWDDTKKFTLTVAFADVAADMTDIPVLVNLTATAGKGPTDVTAIFTEIGVNYKRIAIKDSAGNDCFVEVERWDSVGLVAQLWFKAPSLSSTVNTTFTLYYLNTHTNNSTYVGGIGSVPGQKVWSNGYRNVLHLSQAPTGVGKILDSVGACQSTPVNMDATDSVAAHIGYGIESNGSDETVLTFLGADIRTATVEISVKNTGDAVKALDGIFGAVTDVGAVCCSFVVKAAAEAALYLNNTGYSTAAVVADWTAWNHFSYSISGTAYTITNHTTASSINGVTASHGYLDAGSVLFYWNTADRRFPGVARGLFISNVVRSDAWRATSYLSRTDALVTYS